MVNRHFILFALAFAAAFSGVAKTFDVDISTGRPAASNEAYYHGETIEFRAVRGRSVVTNVDYGCIYYQTNGMGDVWWRTDGLVFHPTNDVGATGYRFFLEGRDEVGRDWHANGLLRLLDSPGFTPNELELPVSRLDFAALDVVNAPYYTKAETDEKIVELAPAPGNYAAVSNRAMNAVSEAASYTDTAVANAATAATNYTDTAVAAMPAPDFSTSNEQLVATIEATAPAPGNYAAVSNAAMNAAAATNDFLRTAGGSIGYLRFPHFDDYGVAIEAMHPGALEFSSNYEYYDGIYAGLDLGRLSPDDIEAELNYIAFLSDIPDVEDFATTGDLAAAATAATNYTDEAVANIDLTGYATTHETETAIRAATNNLVSAAELPGEVYRIVAGTNIVDVVTNYDSAVHAPARYLQQLATNGTWKTIWAETNGLARTLAAAKAETSAATNALAQVKADRAWSKYTSALGAPAPEGTTWLSTPTTVIAGGYEYARTVTSSGQYWFLTSNGMTLEQGATNSYLNISALDGTPIFRVEKTDAILVGVRATEISMVGSVAIVSVPVVGAHPYARVASNLVNATWYKEDGDGMPQGSPASVTWSGSSGAWVATIDFGILPQGFCRFEQVQEGITKIVNNGVTELSGGIIFNGVKYMPTVNGNKLEFVAQ